MTGLATKDYAHGLLEAFLRERPADRTDFLLFMDLDNFKQVNDTLGHAEGDRVLSQVGALLRELFAADALAARFGGDEFLIYRQNADADTVRREAQAIIDRVNALQPGRAKGGPGAAGPDLPMRCSVGILALAPDARAFDPLFARVDRMLYASKHAGRNCWTMTRADGTVESGCEAPPPTAGNGRNPKNKGKAKES